MKFLITILLLTSLVHNSAAAIVSEEHRDSVVNYASGLAGVPYRYGGTSQKGFDCSGFVYYVFKYFKHAVPRSSAGYKAFGTKVSLINCRPGDVIVFTGTNSAVRKPGHVGIVLKNENGNIDFIHASSSKKNYGVTITHYNGSGYVKRFLSVVNVFNV